MLTIRNMTLPQSATAELLYLADVAITDGAAGLVVDEAVALEAIDRALAARHDDLDEVTAECYQLLDLEFGARRHWNQCFVVAARLCGVTS